MRTIHEEPAFTAACARAQAAPPGNGEISAAARWLLALEPDLTRFPAVGITRHGVLRVLVSSHSPAFGQASVFFLTSRDDEAVTLVDVHLSRRAPLP